MSTINTYSDIDRRDSLQNKFAEVDNTIYVEEVSLTAANILAMNATPVEVVAAPGAGKVIEVVGATLILDHGSSAFASGGTVVMEDSAAEPVTASIDASFITAGADTIGVIPIPAATYTMAENSAIYITNGTGAFTGGTGSVVRLKIAYRVHETGL